MDRSNGRRVVEPHGGYQARTEDRMVSGIDCIVVGRWVVKGQCCTIHSVTCVGGAERKPLSIARYHPGTLWSRGERASSNHGGDDRTGGKQSCGFSIGCDGEPLDRGWWIATAEVMARSPMGVGLWGTGFSARGLRARDFI